MWEEIDESIAQRDGLAKGVAFEKSIQSRSALKRASVSYLFLRSFLLPFALTLSFWADTGGHRKSCLVSSKSPG